MSDDRNPVEAALDLVFYAPLGLAITAAEEVPKLAAKGRKRFSGQWATARVVGQFAVAQGRKQAADRFSRPAAPTPAAPTPAAPTPAAPTPAAARPPVVAAPVGQTPPAPTAEPTPRPAPKPDPAPKPTPGPVPAADALAIPDYDSLSASQVVQRLAGLATAELDAVGRYEAGTRGRRTILSRVAQLQAG